MNQILKKDSDAHVTNKLVLIDGNSIIYRAFFALPLLNNDKGVYTNAVYGFTTMLMRILEEEKPTHMLVAFDAGKTTFRHSSYKDYKGGREKTPAELSEQFPIAREVLESFNISHYELPMYEADDIIGTLATQAKEENWDVKVISGDQDLLQLVSDQVTVDLTRKGISDVDSYTPEFLKEKMGVRPDQIIDLKAFMGDSSDNIPGVPGVGIKTATKLLQAHDTLEAVYESLEEVSGKKLKENLVTYKEDALLSQQLVTIDVEAPIEVTLEDAHYDGYDAQKLLTTFKDLGFQSLVSRIDGVTEEEAQPLTEVAYEIAEEVTEEMFSGDDAVLIEMIGDSYHTEDIQAIGIANEDSVTIIPTEVALQSAIFKEWAENSSQKKIVFDTKQTIVALHNEGINLRGIDFDMILASYLLKPSENHHDIPSIAHRLGRTDVKYDEEVYGKGAKQHVPDIEIVAEHVARKVTIIKQLQDELIADLKDNNQYKLYTELEMPLAPILAKMEYTGVQVDVEQLKEMGTDLSDRLKGIEQDIIDDAGEEFNVNSPKQLGVILFENLQLPVIKKTKTGYSTAAGVLEQLEDQHPIISKILLYRQLKKLHSTYIEGLLKVVDDQTNKIHTRFNQALTQTGRLSSIEPNLQNIPIRLEEGRQIRKAFVPSADDMVIFAADYSQIELRVLAHIAKDERLIEAFNEQIDIHTQTAGKVFHVPYEEVTSDMRDQAKAVNFGIVYGISDYGLSQNLGISRKEAKDFIDRYFHIYPGVKEYMEEIVQQAKHDGYVSTLMNRRRYVPEITARNFNVRSFAERTAINTPIQGSAADIIKQAMIDLQYALEEENLEARMLLQVHDELILEAPTSELERLKELVPEVMEKTVSLIVPLRVDYSYGKSWYDAN